ncbi:TolC family protein [Sphingobacterium sp. DK4209]|uniref:TolC family protein n=1 Tax=Sphingobacterium zhuxiongii TaxID=2662364 RepID=A0A5Q0Q9J7_9SPHI|nr:MULTISPECIES: TolC family protein [unclassified Sphingobacterium]MVZ66996.1 TolC family protein [Sphingobacterium sp. DK4209]QGA25944.1 TolC family protein [Sphingobacterium sp. dk4302]
MNINFKCLFGSIYGLLFPFLVLAQHASQPLRLEDLFNLADSGNRELTLHSLQEQIATSRLKEQTDKRLPNLETSLTASYMGNGYITDRDFSNGMSIPIPKLGNSFSIEAQQLIYTGGAVKQSISLAKDDITQATLSSEESKQRLRFLIAGHYLELQKLSNQRTILEKNIQQTLKMIDQINQKLAQGVALKNNVTRYELQLEYLQTSLLKVENAKTIRLKELRLLLQYPANVDLNVAFEESLFEESDSVDTKVWKDIAMERSPILMQAALNVVQAEKRQKLVRAERYPQIFAFAGNYLNGPVMIEIPILNNNFNYWTAGVGIKYSLSSIYKNKAKEARAKLALENAEELNRINQDQLMLAVERTLIQYEETLAVHQSHLKALDLANQNYTIVKNRFLNDMVLMTEMLDAENSQIDASLQASNSKINILFQLFHLKQLTGTL